MRQIVLDTETTGLEPEKGHRVVELGAVEIVDRQVTGKRIQFYIDPEREIDDAASDVHGIDQAFLSGKPKFADVAEEFLDFVSDAEVIMHNAPFDLSFIDYELKLLDSGRSLAERCTVTDSLALARRKHPGQKNSLDALCRRYHVDNAKRELHGALLDAEILADVYLAMTGGQMTLFGTSDEVDLDEAVEHEPVRLPAERPVVPVLLATPDELAAHEAYLDHLDQVAEHGAVWRQAASREAGDHRRTGESA